MNNKRTKGENVYQLVQKRLKFLFNEFDNIYVSFSGGKDSGVLLNLCIQYIREHNLDRKIGVYHMDYEEQYQMTTEYVEQTFRENQDILEIYHVCVPFKVVTCASMFQTYWRPWDESMHAHWVRPMPKNCYKKEDFPFYNEEMWDYTFQTSFASWYHKKHDAVRTCCLVGIRTQESLDRWRTIHGNNRLNSYHNLMWTRRLGYDLYNAYPIYDWTTEDIWTAYARFKWPFNQMYELYYKAGVPLDRQRVASPFLSTAQETLKLYKAIDPNTWGNVRPSKRSKLYRNLWWNPCHGMAKHQITRRLHMERVYVLPVRYVTRRNQTVLFGKTKSKPGILEIQGRMPRFINYTQVN